MTRDEENAWVARHFPSIAGARSWAKKYSLTGIVIIAFDGAEYRMASYGSTKARCTALGQFLEQFEKTMESDVEKLALLGGRP